MSSSDSEEYNPTASVATPQQQQQATTKATAAVSPAVAAQLAQPSAAAAWTTSTFQAHPCSIGSLAVNPSGTILCSCDSQGTLNMWDFGNAIEETAGKPTRSLTPFPNRIQGFQPIVSTKFSCDGKFFVACQDGDSALLVTSYGKTMEMCAIGQRSMTDVVRCTGHRAALTSCCTHPTSAQHFVTGSCDSTARMWDAQKVKSGSTYAVKHGTGTLTDSPQVFAVANMTCCGSGSSSLCFASGGSDGVVQVWDPRKPYRPNSAVLTFQPTTSFPAIAGVCELMKHQLCVTHASDGTLRFYDVRKSSTEVYPAAEGLVPVARDSSTLLADDEEHSYSLPPSILTVTSKKGFKGVAGGHLVRLTLDLSQGSVVAAGVLLSSSEHALDVCRDKTTSAGAQQIFVGLGDGTCAVLYRAGAKGGYESWAAMKPAAGKGRAKTGVISTAQAADEEEEPSSKMRRIERY